MTEKSWKVIRGALLAASVMAALKMIFFDFALDEEYQIVMAYRSISGDSLFVQMWNPIRRQLFCARF
ncbi:MAG: hypothetical protein LUC90_07525 [Lachnospiraceae bacterium]|nr:hypothetical protein [Lachnospiraceae bacterium]